METRKPSSSPPRGPLLLFVTSSVPEAAAVTETVQKIAPLPLVKKANEGGRVSKKQQAGAWPM